MKRWIRSASQGLLLFVLCCPAAGAATLDIRPDELQPMISGSAYALFPNYGTGTAVFLTTVVNLPVNKTVKKLTLHYNNGYEAGAAATLYRVKMGSVAQLMAETGSGTQSPDAQIHTVTSTAIDYPTVTSGYTYFLVVYLVNINTYLYGVQVTYQ